MGHGRGRDGGATGGRAAHEREDGPHSIRIVSSQDRNVMWTRCIWVRP